MTSDERRPFGWIPVAVAITAAAAIARLWSLTSSEASADPWRHMTLVRNLQAGRGFVLYDDQPFLWYSPVWHYVASILTSPDRLDWLAACLAALAAVLTVIYLHQITNGDRKAAFYGGAVMALWGPAVSLTAQPGSEGLATFLLVLALVVSMSSGSVLSGGASGVLTGTSIILRPPFVFDLLLFGAIASSRRRAAFALGVAIPMVLHWWRNQRIIAATPFVFSWDGLATRSDEYNLLSTLFVHLHPAVDRALVHLHGGMKTAPEWLVVGGTVRWEMAFFLAASGFCLAMCRHRPVQMAAVATIAGVVLLDDTGTMNFYRAWVGFFPVLALAIALGLSEAEKRGWWRPWTSFGVLLVLVSTGLPHLQRTTRIPLEEVTPPVERLSEARYMVASGFHHPDSLVWRFPETRFVGMPLDPRDFDDFAASFPAYEAVLWHPVGVQVQSELFQWLARSPRYEISSRWRNEAGYEYLVMKRLR